MPTFGEWEKIKTAPKDGSLVMVWDQSFYLSIWHIHERCWIEVGHSLVLHPTHWMKLPDPPKESK